MQTASPSDAPNAERLPALDVVRGIAVLGILAANIIGMGQPMSAYGWPAGFLSPPGPLSVELWAAQQVLVDGKFRGLFTLLFGAGMVLFWRRAPARGAGTGLLARRLCWLGLFGLLHWLLLWRGDILLPYAIAGFIALPFLGWAAERQFALGLIGYLVGAALMLGIVALITGMPPDDLREVARQDMADGIAEGRIMASGSYIAWIAHSLSAHWSELPANLLFILFETVPLLLIGMSLVDAGIFDGRAGARRQARWGGALWLGGTLVTSAIALRAVTGGIDYAESMAVPAWAAFPTLAASLGLMALLAVWGQSAHGALARRLAAAGQCAFTNYIGTSALALAVFFGLGLFGTLGRLELYGVMLAFWALMLAWPMWWLTRFRHGPLEWAWRCLTYGRVVPLAR